MNLMPSDAAFTSDAALLQRLLTKAHRPNVLVECQDGGARAVVWRLTQTGVPPICHCVLPGALALPDVRQGTLLLENVTALTAAQQQDLHAWLADGSAQMQVVSVATESLPAAVHDGRFLEALYYRLNIVRVDTPATAEPSTTH